MSTPKDAPYKEKQRELDRRRQTAWIPDPKLDEHVTADGTVYQRTKQGLRNVGQLEADQLKLERERRASAIAEFLS